MNNKKTSNNWVREFQIFVSAAEIRPPEALSARVLADVHAELNPAAWLVFFKVSLIHLLVGAFTLLFCPQFGIGIFQGMGLMGLLMRFGSTICMLGCGAVFLGSSALVASFLLKPEEVKVIRRNKLLQFGLLGTLSVGVFICLGTAVIATLTLAWLIGSVLGALGTLELGWYLRSHRLTARGI